MIKPKTDPLELKAEKLLKRLWKVVRKESIRFIRWMFFYKPENDMDAIFHIIVVISYIMVGVALARG
ncbi:hypothetical protein M0R04_16090 [Candidatus Dojkabacteria bacterium]|jgi:hypothetical protein|nr:hypothetical protein [Candidatus Dojkabacteria bacterium]